MTSKERVLKAISLQEADRVPVDLWATKEYVRALMGFLGIEDESHLHRYLETDIRYVYGQGAVYENGISLFSPSVVYTGPPHDTFEDGSFTDLWGAVRQYRRSSFGDVFREVVKPPLAHAESVKEVEAYSGWPKKEWFDYSSIVEYCKDNRDYALFFGGMPGMATIFIQCWYIRGLQQTLEDLYVNPVLIEAVIAHITEFQLSFHKEVLDTASEWIDVVQIGDDYGTENSLMMSPEIFRKIFKPQLKKLISLVKSYGKKVMLHSDGNVRKLIPDFIEIGVDILNPIQWGGIPDMNLKELKEEFGQHICFHGGIDTQDFLPGADKNDLKGYTRRVMDSLGKNGGYIMSPTHTLELDVPLENCVSLYKECPRDPF